MLRSFSRFTNLLAVTLVAVLLFGVVAPAAAQGPGDDDDDAPFGGPGRGPGFGEGRDFGPFGDRDGRRGPGMMMGLWQRNVMQNTAVLAEAFGISEAELQAYFDDGLTVRDVAQELDANLDNVLEQVRAANQAERNATLAAAFGITVEELEAYFADGLNIREIAQELDINFDNVQEQLRAQVEAERNATLAAAFGISVEALEAYFADGLNIREIAQELDVNLDNVLEELGIQGFEGRDFRGPRGRGFDGPRGRMQDNAPFGTTAPNRPSTDTPNTAGAEG